MCGQTSDLHVPCYMSVPIYSWPTASMGSSTEGHLYYATLYKGPEHLQNFVWSGRVFLGPMPPDTGR